MSLSISSKTGTRWQDNLEDRKKVWLREVSLQINVQVQVHLRDNKWQSLKTYQETFLNFFVFSNVDISISTSLVKDYITLLNGTVCSTAD